jgi:hypothetical protein
MAVIGPDDALAPLEVLLEQLIWIKLEVAGGVICIAKRNGRRDNPETVTYHAQEQATRLDTRAAGEIGE